MVGLSVLLEAHQTSQVINKATMIKPSPPPLFPSSSSSSTTTCYSSSPLPAISFLDECYLCKQKLFPGKDIFMYNGDRAFCSMECRCRQIVMDEESVGLFTKKSKASAASSARPCKSNQKRGAGRFAF